jgi:hypothetical protein
MKINTDRKRSSYIMKDCFEKSHNYCSRGDRTAELNIHLEDPVSTKTVQYELHKSNLHSRAATAKTVITESNVQMHERLCHDRKTWTSDNWKWAHDMVRRCSLHQEEFTVYVWRTPMEAYNLECMLPTVKHGGGSAMVWAGILWYSVGPIITLHGQITAKE